MAPRPHAFSLVLAALAAAPCALAQELRRALVDADVVTVARQIGKQDFSEDVQLHRLQIITNLRGLIDGTTTVTVLDWPKLSIHLRPQPRQSRIYCLHDASREAARIGLPSAGGPYYRMSGRAGSNPLVGQDLQADAIGRFALTLAAIERGTAPAANAATLLQMALHDDATVRLEATRHFAEQPLLRANIAPTQWSLVLGRMVAETDDVDYKTALAELCAEQRLDGTIEALVTGVGPSPSPQWSRTVGRLCAAVLGEEAATPLLRRLQTTGDAPTRANVLLAIGATRTDPALEALLQLKDAQAADPAVDAALREHGSRRAVEAAVRGKDKEAK